MSDKEPTKTEALANLANQMSRSMTAIVDTMSQRGAIKGEEMSTIGRMRDQCTQMAQLSEEVLNELTEGGPSND